MSTTEEVIFPPLYIRSVIDKTAQFVAKNGQHFENRIRFDQSNSSGTNNNKFSFLDPQNAYHLYYKLKLSEIQGNKVPEINPSIPQAILDKRKRLELKNKHKERLLALSDFRSASESLQKPEDDLFTHTFPFISSLDLEIIKNTALFVARNGHKFLVDLNKREKNNPQYDFLNPSHYLFSFFSNITDSYTKCLVPPKSQIEKLNQIGKDRLYYLQLCQKRADWDANEAEKLESEEARKQEEKMEMMSLDWYSFFIAETIKFSDVDEDLPVPIDFSNPDALLRFSYNSLFAPKAEVELKEVLVKDISEIDSKIDLSEQLVRPEVPVEKVEPPLKPETEEASVQPSKFSDPPVSTKPVRDDTRIVQDGDEVIKVKKTYSRTKKSSDTVMQKCPITGQMVPSSEMSEHLRILLLDPKWKEQKDKFIEKAMLDSALAPLEDVGSNLSSLVARRPDIFGSPEEEIKDHTEGNQYINLNDAKRKKV
ncbi:splicing factor 3 subunit 1 [Theileria orientalis]|uniref:Splicing factor 3 subunit 1 n=1 Tax=Theileria orientalis TaxID=68886 RepID=A0A976M818_THEOR|nr:splicing factor 3 subunit 1 [Theileria orientalis]